MKRRKDSMEIDTTILLRVLESAMGFIIIIIGIFYAIAFITTRKKRRK